MAKSFYTLEETAAKLRKTAAEVNAIVDTGRLQRVMHEGQPKFRVEQVDLLANVMGDGGAPRLDDSQGPIGLADSSGGSAIGAPPPVAGRRGSNEDSVLGLADTSVGGRPPSLIDSAERTGVSALGNRGGGDAVEIGHETVGSGSGLLDLTRESEETALGAELIDQVYSSEGGEAAGGASGLFEAVSSSPGYGAAPMAATGMVVTEAYDGAWSGVGVGLMVAALIGLVVAGLIAVGIVFGAGSGIASSFSGNLFVWGGSLAGIAAVCGVVGFVVGRASE
jgi:hypothetical protein